MVHLATELALHDNKTLHNGQALHDHKIEIDMANDEF